MITKSHGNNKLICIADYGDLTSDVQRILQILPDFSNVEIETVTLDRKYKRSYMLVLAAKSLFKNPCELDMNFATEEKITIITEEMANYIYKSSTISGKQLIMILQEAKKIFNFPIKKINRN